MILERENRNTFSACLRATLSALHFTRTDEGSNTGQRYAKPATKRLSNCKMGVLSVTGDRNCRGASGGLSYRHKTDNRIIPRVLLVR